MKTDALDAINKLAPCRTHDEAHAFFKRFGKAPEGWEVELRGESVRVRTVDGMYTIVFGMHPGDWDWISHAALRSLTPSECV